MWTRVAQAAKLASERLINMTDQDADDLDLEVAP
jgi:hypothetical protein